jgi:excisionase family DNA binding protein
MTELMNIEEVSQYLRVVKKTTYRLLKRGEIPASKVGRQWRFDKEKIDVWLQNNMERAGARILVIDDNESILAVFRETLEGDGHIVVTADTGAKGLEYMTQQDFNLVFLDLNMLKADGAEVLREIRGIKQNLPAMIITGYPDSAMMNRAMKLGPLGVMLKPFGDSDIRTVVSSFHYGNRKTG